MAMSGAEKREKLPRSGSAWSRRPDFWSNDEPLSRSTWTDGRLVVITDLILAEAPDGSGDLIEQWHLSATHLGARCSDREMRRVRRDFGMRDAEEDNHHPGNARNLFLPVDPKRRVDCECKATETVVVEVDGYTWTNPTDARCRGCELEELIGKPCSLHAPGGQG